MASASDKYKENAQGPFYTDTQCIDCDLCRQTAPAFFDRNKAGGFSFVYKQPETADELLLCQQALEECPVEAIGNNGLE